MGIEGIVFTAPGVVELRDDLELPELGPGDIEIITKASGVSPGTEKNRLFGGNWAVGYPSVSGYQQVGQVGRVGNGVIGPNTGQRVYAHDWGHPFVGQTARPGAHAAARIGPADDILPGTRPADEQVDVDQVDSFGRIRRDRYVTVLPDDISDGEAAFLSLSSIGLHASGRGQIGVGGRCLVLGLGLLGLFSGQGTVVRGGTSVGVDKIPLRLDKAMEVGFESVLDFSRETYWDDLAGLGPFDVVIETTGNNELIDEVMTRRLIKRGGRFVMVGGRWKVSYDFSLAHLYEVSMVQTEHHTYDEVQQVIQLRRVGRWKIGPLLTHFVRPSDAKRVWDMILNNENSLGVVFEWVEE